MVRLTRMSGDNRNLGACPTLTFLLRRTILDHLRRSRPEKILNVFQRIHLRFFRACGLASGRTSFAASRTAMPARLLAWLVVSAGLLLISLCPVLSTAEWGKPLGGTYGGPEGKPRVVTPLPAELGA